MKWKYNEKKQEIKTMQYLIGSIFFLLTTIGLTGLVYSFFQTNELLQIIAFIISYILTMFSLPATISWLKYIVKNTKSFDELLIEGY